jgi:hypothetical protein
MRRRIVLFERAVSKAEAIRRIGEDARTLARATGTAVPYTEPAYGTNVIREYPDGRRERRRPDGSVESVPPRDR